MSSEDFPTLSSLMRALVLCLFCATVVTNCGTGVTTQLLYHSNRGSDADWLSLHESSVNTALQTRYHHFLSAVRAE